MADIAQLVRAPGCGSGGRGFETHYSPQIKYWYLLPVFYLYLNFTNSFDVSAQTIKTSG